MKIPDSRHCNGSTSESQVALILQISLSHGGASNDSYNFVFVGTFQNSFVTKSWISFLNQLIVDVQISVDSNVHRPNESSYSYTQFQQSICVLSPRRMLVLLV